MLAKPPSSGKPKAPPEVRTRPFYRLAKPPSNIYFNAMITSLRIIAVVFAILSVARGVEAMPALVGTVTGPNGHPVAGAEIRIATTDTGSVLKVARTDASGHYASAMVPSDKYRVSLVVNGATKACIKNAAILEGNPTELNFDLQAGARPLATGKHFVWVPASTGSQLGGQWVEVGNDLQPLATGMKERIRWQPNAQMRIWQSNSGANPNQM